jgi:acyl-coenzyme A synthetase/AMP-(fatty) acid ligase
MGTSSIALRPDEMYRTSALRRVRADLAARWRRDGRTVGRSLAEQAELAASVHATTRLVFPSAERPSQLTLSDLWDRARTVGAGLAARGVGPGDVVAVQVPNWAEAAIAYVATAATGATVVPIVHTYGPSETDWILERVNARCFVLPGVWGDRDYLERLDQMPAHKDVETVVVVGDQAPSGAITWESLEGNAPGMIEPVRVAADAPLLLTFTSGTTSEPKGVVHSHDSFIAELHTMPSPPALPPNIRTLQPWPAGHIGGMTAIMGPLVHGHDTFLLDRWETDAVVDLIQCEEVYACSGVPTALFRVIDAVEARGIALPLKELTTGGAGIPSSLIERAERIGWHIGRCYGSSEHPSATVCVRGDSREHRLHSDGRPMRGSFVRTLHDDLTDCDVGEEGEIALIGAEQFLGYTDPALNEETFTPDGWLLTGDIGTLDEDGFLRVTDRKKDLIIRGGENISSVEVEEILMRHPAIAEAVVVAMPDPQYGERVCAFVVAQPESTLELADVRAHFATSGVQRLKTPEALRLVADVDLPRTPSGKVQKRALRDLLRSEGHLDRVEETRNER